MLRRILFFGDEWRTWRFGVAEAQNPGCWMTASLTIPAMPAR
jgi:hypothetical protein